MNFKQWVRVNVVFLELQESHHRTYVVNNVLLHFVIVRFRLVDRTNYIHLVVLERRVVLVHIYYVIRIVYSKSETKEKVFR
jgi:hypothetical protein